MSEQSEYERLNIRWEQRQAAFTALAQQQNAVNKAMLLSALAQADIDTATVSFDGYGDEGRIEAVTAAAKDAEAQIPSILVPLQRVEYHTLKVMAVDEPLSHALATMAEDLLDQTHRYWEDGDGAYGEVVFDVAGDRIVVDFNARVTVSQPSEHVI